MTVRLPAWLQAGAYTAEIDRTVGTSLLMPGSAIGARGGVRRWSGNEFQVVATAPATMQIAVKPGMAWVQGAYSTLQGAYVVVNDADVNLSIAGAHATLSRIDLIVLEILDSTYFGGSNLGQLRVVLGTPASNPIAPTVTGSFIVLAQVRVNPGVTSIAASAITDVRPYVGAVGGILPVKNQTERIALTGLSAGTDVLELDTGRVYQYGFGSGTTWVYAYGGTAPVSWVTPTLLNGWKLFPDTGTVWRGPRFRKLPHGQVEVQGMVKSGTAGSAIFQLPVGYRPSLQLIFVCAVGTSINTYGRLDIFSNGNVVNTSPSDVSWLSLNCTFTTD